MLSARVRRPGSTLKLVRTWTGPWRVVTADKVYAQEVQNMVSGEAKAVHVARLGVHANGASEVTADLKEVFQ